MDDVELDQRIRSSVAAIVARAPEPRPFPGSQETNDRHLSPIDGRHRANGSGRSSLIGVAAAITALVGWGAWSLASAPAPVDTIGEGLVVAHEVVTYEQSFDIVCPNGEAIITGEFDTMVFESWGSQDLGRWRQVVRYPDGSERGLLATDSPWYPTELFTTGEVRGQQIGCSGNANLLQQPGQSGWFYLNPMSDRPNIPGSQETAVPSYADLGQLVDDAAIGPDGRSVELWRQVIDGTYGSASMSGALRQVEEWLVDPVNGQVLQRSFSQTYEGLGEIRWTARLDVFESTTVDPNLFITDGLTQQPQEFTPGRPTSETPTQPTQPRATPGE